MPAQRDIQGGGRGRGPIFFFAYFGANVFSIIKFSEKQESMNRTLPLHYILESTFACIFLLLELTLQQETHIYINLTNLYKLFVLFFLRLIIPLF